MSCAKNLVALRALASAALLAAGAGALAQAPAAAKPATPGAAAPVGARPAAAPAPAPAPTPAASPAGTPVRTLLSAAPCEKVDIAPMVQIPVGKSTVIRPRAPITRILLGNPENARAARPSDQPDAKKDDGPKAPSSRPGVADVDVLLLGPTEVYLLGKTIGSTNVVMIDRDSRCTAIDVVVQLDVTALQAAISQLLPDEKSVKVTPAFDSVVLTGSVTDAEALVRVTDLANAYVRGGGDLAAKNTRIVNMLEVGSPQQVMLEVKVAEVSKSLVDKLGVRLTGSRTTGDWTYQLLADFLTGANSVVSAAKNTGAFGLTIDAQKDDGLVKVLAEPTIMAISGQTGSFLAGGKIFIPVSQSNDNGGRTITLEEKEFGVALKFTPTVLGGGRINLRVRPEVSELNRDGVSIVASNGVAVLPSFTSRKAETTVQLMDGQSFAIGGLIKNNVTTNVKAFPFLGEVPMLGALFRSTDFQTDRSELVFVITPRLVKPLPSDYRLPTDGYVPPNRRERMLDGRLEGGAPAAASPASPAAQPAAGGFDTQPTEKK